MAKGSFKHMMYLVKGLTGNASNEVLYTFPQCTSLKYGIEQIEKANTGRNEQGYMIRDRVAIKRTIEATFPPMRQQEMYVLLQKCLMEGYNYYKNLFVRYTDPRTNASRVIQCYCSIGDIEVYTYRNGSTAIGTDDRGSTDIWYKPVTIKFIEY